MNNSGVTSIYIVGNRILPQGSPGSILSDEGYAVTESYGEEALNIIVKSPSDISLIILCMHDTSESELAMLKSITEQFPMVPVITYSDSADIELAVSSMKLGAADFISTGTGKTNILLRIHTVLSHAYPLNQIRVLKKSLRRNKIFRSILGESETMQKVFATTELIMDRDVNVLILGESGTGKELLARAIHDGSHRSKGPFVAVNCASISVDLAESLLFGHTRGSFTGAISDHKGYFEQANEGTIFLDEIGDMNPLVQASVLRVIEERKVRKVGANNEISINVRIISATNRNLRKFVEEGKFREDLYFRLDEYPIKIPPLKERREDIPLLAQEFLKEFCEFYEINVMQFSPEAVRQLQNYPWPGNIRELKNLARRAAVQSTDVVIDTIPFPESSMEPAPEDDGKEIDIKKELINANQSLPADDTFPSKVETGSDERIIPLEELEKNEIIKAYHKTNSHVDEAALLLGISRATLYRKLKRYGIL